MLTLLTLANRQGNLESMLKEMGFEDLLAVEPARTKRILVLGNSQVNAGKLKAIARKCGFDPSDFVFCLEYDRLKHFNFRKLQYSDTYMAVLAGPQPHSTSGKGKASNAIAEMERNASAYPRVIRLMDSNELKITATSFKKALEQLQWPSTLYPTSPTTNPLSHQAQ